MNLIKNNAKHIFLRNAVKLTFIMLILRLVGMLFMIFIANKIGAEGIGLYQLTFSVYFFFTTIATAGISLATTRIVSEQIALGDKKTASNALSHCIFLSIILSAFAGIILFFCAKTISISIIKDERVMLPLKLLALGLPFLSVSSTIRGFFIGLKNGVKASIIDVVEQLVQIIVTYPLLIIFGTKSIEYACISLIIGSTASEIVSCIYAVLSYYKNRLHYEKTAIKKVGILKKIFSIIIPVALSSYVRSILTTLENILVPSGLKKRGLSQEKSLAEYGTIKGMVLPIIYFPSAILSAFACLLVPEVSEAAAKNQTKRITYIINRSLKVTLAFAIFVTAMFFCYSNEIGMAIFHSKQVGMLLKTFAPLIPLMYIDMIVDSILKGLNQQLSSMKYNTIDSIMRAGLIFVLIPLMGINGYVVMLYCGTIFNALLSINRLIIVSKIKFQYVDWLIIPSFTIAIICCVTTIFKVTNVWVNMIFIGIIYLFVMQKINSKK